MITVVLFNLGHSMILWTTLEMFYGKTCERHLVDTGWPPYFPLGYPCHWGHSPGAQNPRSLQKHVSEEVKGKESCGWWVTLGFICPTSAPQQQVIVAFTVACCLAMSPYWTPYQLQASLVMDSDLTEAQLRNTLMVWILFKLIDS